MSDQLELLPLGDGVLGWAFASSRVGSSHARTGKPGQDSYALWSGAVAGQSCLVAAVADGHGDDRHDLSQYGSAIAVRAAIDEMIGLQTHFGAAGLSSKLVKNFKSDFPRRLGKRWRESVIGDAKARLPPEGVKDDQNNPELFLRYGTTLLAAMAVGNTLLVAQIGDGVTMLVKPDGSVILPVSCENDDVGVVTDSLCSNEAHRRWRIGALDSSQGGLLLLSTDGLVNAFSDQDQMNAFAHSLKDRMLEFGLLKVASSLPGWLDHYSTRGSGDDITLAVVMIQPKSDEIPVETAIAEITNKDVDDPSQGV